MLVYRKTAYTGKSYYSVVVVVVSWRERERRLEQKNYTRNAHAHVHNTYVIPYTYYYYYTYGGYIPPGRGGKDGGTIADCHPSVMFGGGGRGVRIPYNIIL